MDHIIDIIISAIPWLEGVVDFVDITISAIPAWGIPTFSIIILAVGGYYILQHFKLAPNPIKGGDWDDDNW